MSKRWRRRFRRIAKATVKVGIAVAGAALSTVTGGASAVLAAAALAAIAKHDAAAAERARQNAAARVAAGQDPVAALLAAIIANAPPIDIHAQLTQGQTPLGQVSYTSVIQNHLAAGPTAVNTFNAGGVYNPDAKPEQKTVIPVEVPPMFALLKARA